MANRHRKATAGEKPDPNTVASVETGNVLDTDPTEDTGGGYAGGSAFAHLTEDVPGGAFNTDSGWYWFKAGDPPSSSVFARIVVFDNPSLLISGDLSGGVPAVDGYGGIVIGDYNEAQWRFQTSLDGSLYWSDGTNPPDIWLKRPSGGGLFILRGDGKGWGVKAGGHEALDALTAPADGDVPNSQRLQWFDDTTGAPRSRFKQRDAGGTLSQGFSTSFDQNEVMRLRDGTPPGSNPTNGGYLFADAGALKYRGSGGTVTTIAPA